jgi:hypothetical protein
MDPLAKAASRSLLGVRMDVGLNWRIDGMGELKLVRLYEDMSKSR